MDHDVVDQELENRLRARGTETEESLAKRLGAAAEEMEYKQHHHQHHRHRHRQHNHHHHLKTHGPFKFFDISKKKSFFLRDIIHSSADIVDDQHF